MTQNHNTFEKVREIIAQQSGNDPDIILADSHLEEDLGIVLETDFSRIIRLINQSFDLHLPAATTSDEVEVVQDLVDLVEEELELG